MKMVEIGANVRLYNGDIAEVLPHIMADGTRADLICTDPPYRLTSGGKTPGGLHERIGDDDYDNSGQIVDCDIDWPDFMPLFYAALAENAHAYVMANNRNVEPMLIEARRAGFRFHNLLYWDKETVTPNRWYMKNAEFTGFFYKGTAFAINDPSSKAGVRCPHRDETKHPTEKPVPLMGMYIRNSTQPGGVVLDPFMGSGTTGVAAVRAGRGFIGIEKNERWFEVARQRIEKEASFTQAEFWS